MSRVRELVHYWALGPIYGLTGQLPCYKLP